MGYTGAKLKPLFSPRPAKRAARKMAVRGAEEFKRNVVQNTPIDDSPFPSREPGTARKSWRVKPIEVLTMLSADTYVTGVETEDPVARYLEEGTGLYGPKHKAYIIRPKDPDGYLRFYSRKTGQWVFAKQVLHPGIHAQRPLATGAAITEHQLAKTLQVELWRWKHEQELAGYRGYD